MIAQSLILISVFSCVPDISEVKQLQHLQTGTRRAAWEERMAVAAVRKATDIFFFKQRMQEEEATLDSPIVFREIS